MDHVPGAPASQDTPDEETIDPQKSNLPCTPDPTKTKTDGQVVAVENAKGIAYGKATGLYSKHPKDWEQWNPRHSFQSAYDFQLAQSYSQQMETWIDQHLRRQMHNSKIEWFRSADVLQCSSRNSTSGMVIIVGLKIIHTSSEYYTTRIFSTVYRSFLYIYHFRSISMFDQCALQIRKVTKYTAWWTWAIGGGIHKISFLLGWWLCQWFVHLTRLTGPIFCAISIPGRCTSQLVIFEMIYTGHVISAPGSSLDWFHVAQKAPTILTRQGILLLELPSLQSGILT